MSSSADDNQIALETHACPCAPDRISMVKAEPWYGYVFSFWGVAILFIVASVVAAGFGIDWWSR